MNDHKIDEQLQRFSSAVAHAAPDPLPMPEPSVRQRFRQPVLVMSFAFVAVMVTLGFGALLVSWGGSSDTSQEVAASGIDTYSDTESYWDWLTTDAVPLETDVVGVTQTGPVPAFDISGYGEVQRLLSHAELPPESYRLANEPLFIPPVAYVGTIEGTATQVRVYRTSVSADGKQRLCLEDHDRSGGGTVCYSDEDLAIGNGVMWMVESETDRDTKTPGSISRITMAMLPRATSIAVVELSDGRTFVQRPIGGAAAFEFEMLGESFGVSVEALDENGDVLTSGTFHGSF